ncbi:MAG: hypothetical protein N3F05_01125 [Candidatus Diapherotrites archaeon]|nr:hypothetical protein [Candidatus Diapherotrites archaeon]
MLLKKPRPLIKKTLILLTLIPANIAIIILRGLELHAGKMPLKFLLIPIIIFFTYLIFSIYGLYLAVKEKKGTSLAIGTVASVFVFGPLLFFYFFIIMMAQSTTPPRGGCDQSSIYKEMCEAKTSERLCIIADLDADGVGDCVWDSKTKECNLDPNKTPAPCYWR